MLLRQDVGDEAGDRELSSAAENLQPLAVAPATADPLEGIGFDGPLPRSSVHGFRIALILMP